MSKGLSNRQLASASASGAVWLLAAQGVAFVSNLATIMVLGRLLSPDVFGVMAMASTVSSFIMLFRDFGFSAAILTHRDLTQEQLSGLYWSNLGFGLVLALITLCLAPGIAWFYREPTLTLVVAALSVGFVFATTGVIQSALLQRDVRFRAISTIQVCSSIAGMLGAIAGGLLGWGIWSLVCMRLVQQATLGLGAWLASRWRPSRYVRGTELGQMYKVAANVSSAQLTSYFSRNSDNILIGWYWGQHALGLYDQAYKLLMVPMQQLGQPINSVLLPLLSRLGEQPALYRSAYLRVMEKVTLLATPLACAMIILPDAIVRAALGDKWLQSAPIVAFLGIAMIYQPASLAAGPLLISQKRSRQLAKYSLVSGILTVTSFAVALPFGPAAVAGSYAISGLLVRMPILNWVVGRAGPVSQLDLYRSYKLPIWAGAFLAPCYWYIGQAPEFGGNPFFQLLAAAVVTPPAMLVALWLLPTGRAAIRDTFAIAKLTIAKDRTPKIDHES